MTGTVVVWIGCGLLAGTGVLVRPPHLHGPRTDQRGPGRRSPGPGRATHWVRVGWSVVCQPGRLTGLTDRARPPSRAASVLTLVDELATQVRAGATPAQAWTAAMATAGGPAMPGEAPRDCLDRLAAAAAAPPALLALRAAWVLCEDVGAPLADVLAAVADGMRQDADVEADIEAALAAPRSTARLLALLPLAGLALGQLLGARPLQVLLHSSVGRLCAAAGLALGLAGHWWARRLVEHTAARL